MRKIFILAAVWLALLGAASPEETLRAIAIAERHRTLADLPALLDREPAIAARAALAIGRVGNSAGVAPLEAHLGARDPAVLAMVVYGLGLLDDTRELTRIRQLARGADDGAVRYAAVDAIGRIVTFRPQLASKAVADDLLAVVQHDAEPAVRGHAAASLDVFGKSPFAPAIAAALERSFATEKDRRSRWHIAWVMARAYPTTVSAAFLRRALASPEELVRLEAVRAWGQRSKASPAVVLPLTKDSSWRVQLEAIEALRRLSGKPATDHLTKLPPGLHLPKIAPFATAPATTGPLPASPQKPGIPTDDQAILQPLLGPVLPALMNGPMPGPHPRVRIVTSKGAIVVRLYPEWAPYTVANFLNLVDSGYYDGLRFFRVVPDFVVQTGDRSNTGEGDAGYTVGAELNPVEERSGVLAMALEYQTGHAVRDSAGTQFYITISPQLHLDRDFTVFGEIQTGFGVLAHLIESDRMLHLERIADG